MGAGFATSPNPNELRGRLSKNLIRTKESRSPLGQSSPVTKRPRLANLGFTKDCQFHGAVAMIYVRVGILGWRFRDFAVSLVGSYCDGALSHSPTVTTWSVAVVALEFATLTHTHLRIPSCSAGIAHPSCTRTCKLMDTARTGS